jgi:ketosteroid isomerase-like protein
VIQVLARGEHRAMSDNLKTAHAIYEAFGRGGVPAILDLLADDVRWEDWADNSAQQAGVAWMAPRRGPDDAEELADRGALTVFTVS